jgi:branched-chain amino acid transport system substrate-binding protein
MSRRISSRMPVAAVLAAAVLVAILGCGSDDEPGTLGVVTSLPLEGQSASVAQDVLDAQRLALDEAGGKAGGFEIELTALSDSTAPPGRWTPQRVRANATQAADDQDTIAYIGDLESAPTAVAMPILNRAGLLQVSPGATATALTQPTDTEPKLAAELRPTGRTTFARVIPNDRLQASALLASVREQGVRRLFIVAEDDEYGRGIASDVAEFAPSRGVEIVGRATVDPGRERANGAAVASDVAASRAQGALYAGASIVTARRVLAAIHAVRPRIALFVPDALSSSEARRTLRSLSRRLTITAPFLAPGDYPPSGQQFMRAFRRRYGRDPAPDAIFGYEAMKATLDSIARAADAGRIDIADTAGSREAVRDAFFKIDRPQSALGAYAIRPNGDTTLSSYGAFEIRHGELSVLQ